MVNTIQLDEVEKHKIGSLHSQISTLSRKLEQLEQLNSLAKDNSLRLQKIIDLLSAENGKLKRKAKRKANKG